MAEGVLSEEPMVAAERAYRHAKTAILEGSLPGGQLVSEGDVADQLGLSRTPVREAFLRLAAEGLLRLFPKRGALVVPVTPEEVDEVRAARRMVESWAARRAGAAEEPELVEVLQRCIALQEQAVATGSPEEAARADDRFHEALVEAGRNKVVSAFHAALGDRRRRMVDMSSGTEPERAESCLAEHGAIVKALARGDGRAAAKRVERHLDREAEWQS